MGCTYFMPESDYTNTLHALEWADFPDEVKHQSKRCLKDILATGAGGLQLPPARKMVDLTASQYAGGPIPMWFTGRSAGFLGACYFNSFLVDSLDWHDGFRMTKGHAGATVVPVAINACASEPVSGRALLTALVMGYEIACRAGLAIHALYNPAYHSSGSWASIGAAAAAAKLRRIPADRLDGILGTAEYYSPVSPMLRCTENPSPLKDGAAAGAWAAAMAIEMYDTGFQGLPSLFTAEPDGQKAIQSLGENWMILRQYFKPYPVCRWAQPAVECVLQLKKDHSFSNDEIESIVIETFREATSLGRFPPQDSDGAQYSIVWSVAAALTDGELKLPQVHPDRLSDPEIIRLGKKVSCVPAKDIQSRFPAECLSRATIILKDGRSLQSPTLSARGDYMDPLPDEEIDAKFAALVTPLNGPEKTGQLSALLDDLENHRSDELLAFL